MAQGNYDDSGLSPEIERLSEQLIKNPNSKLFIPLAEEYMKADMAEEAIMTLEEGLKVHPGYMSARVLLGKAHLQKGDMDKACGQFEAVIKAVPDNLYAHKKLGEIYLALNRRDEALKAYKILYLLSPKDEEISDIVSQLESGQMPDSPLSVGEQDKAKEKAGEAAPAASETAAVKAAPAETPAPGAAAPIAKGLGEAAPPKASAPETAGGEASPGEAAPAEMGMAQAAPAEPAAPETAVGEPAPQEGADFEIGEAEQEELEGAAPVYEIDEELPGMEPEEPGAEIPAPEDDVFGKIESAPGPDLESPFDIGDKVPYESVGEQPLDLDKQATTEEAGSGGEQGVYDLDAGMGMAAGQDGPLFEEPETAGGASPSEEIQEIFSSYEGGQPETPAEEAEDTEGAGDSVYEIDEPSDLDLEELGVKTSVPPEQQAEDAGQADIPEMPFEIEGESDMTVPAEIDFGDMGGGEADLESPFETAGAEGAPVEELPFDLGGGEAELESPFEEAGAGEAPVEELPFDLGGGETEFESPFETVEAEDAQVEELPFDLGGETELDSPFEAVEAGTAEQTEPSAGFPADETDVAKDTHEPIKTETLAEMYIRQGFYDRAIGIYKDMLKDKPGELSIKQKLEELYMLASLGSEKKVSDQAEASSAEAVVEPADFVLDAQAATAPEAEASAGAQPAVADELAGEPVGPEARGKLEQFLENIRRKAGQ